MIDVASPPTVDQAAPPTRRTRRLPVQRGATWLVALIVVVLVAGPLATLLLASFRADALTLPFDAGARFRFDNFVKVATDPQLASLSWNTTLFTAATLVVGISVSVILAWVVERTDIPLQSMIFALVIAPIGMPVLVAGIAWSQLLAKNEGFVNVVLRNALGLDGDGPFNINSVAGMVFVEALIIVPFSFLLITPVFRAMDPALEEAAATAGAGPWGRLRSVVAPLMWPSLFAVVIYQFVTVVQAFEVPVIIGLNAGIRVFSTRVFEALQPTNSGLPDYGIASSYSLLLLAVSLIPMIWYYRLLKKSEQFATVTGKGFRPRRHSLGRWKYPVYLFVGLYLLVSFILPVLMMVWMSIQPFYSAPSAESFSRITFSAYSSLFSSDGLVAVARNTLVLGVLSATGITVLAVIHGWVLVRTRTRLSRVVDALAFITHGIPGIVVGVSLLFGGIALSQVLPVPLYGRVSILVIGMLIVTMGFATRIMVSAVARLHPELEEAALISGASWLTTMTQVVGRLLLPAIINVWVLAFVYAITNLSLTVILGTSTNRVLAVNLFTFWNFGKTAQAAAIAVILMAVSIALTMVLRIRLGSNEER